MHKNEHRKVHRRKEWSVDIAYRVKYTMVGSEVNEKNTRKSKKRWQELDDSEWDNKKVMKGYIVEVENTRRWYVMLANKI